MAYAPQQRDAAAVAAAVAESRARYEAALAEEAAEDAGEAELMREARGDPAYYARPAVTTLCVAAGLCHIAAIVIPYYVQLADKEGPLDAFSESVHHFPQRPTAGLLAGAGAAGFLAGPLACGSRRADAPNRALSAAALSLALGLAGLGVACSDAARLVADLAAGRGGGPVPAALFALAAALALTALALALLVSWRQLDRNAAAAAAASRAQRVAQLLSAAYGGVAVANPLRA